MRNPVKLTLREPSCWWSSQRWAAGERGRSAAVSLGEERGPMDGITRYSVTDLWVFSGEDLTAVAAAFEARGLVVSHPAYWITDTEYWRIAEPQWYWAFQTPCEETSEDPEPHIAALLAAVEALDPPARAAWARCSHRVFDVAYDCGTRPHAVRHNLSTSTLARLAAVGGTLRVTLYALDPSDIRPAEPDDAADSGVYPLNKAKGGTTPGANS